MYVLFKGGNEQEDQKTTIGFKVNLLLFDIFSSGHIYKLSEARNGLLYTTLCIYMPQWMWIASYTSLSKTDARTKKEKCRN